MNNLIIFGLILVVIILIVIFYYLQGDYTSFILEPFISNEENDEDNNVLIKSVHHINLKDLKKKKKDNKDN